MADWITKYHIVQGQNVGLGLPVSSRASDGWGGVQAAVAVSEKLPPRQVRLYLDQTTQQQAQDNDDHQDNVFIKLGGETEGLGTGEDVVDAKQDETSEIRRAQRSTYRLFISDSGFHGNMFIAKERPPNRRPPQYFDVDRVIATSSQYDAALIVASYIPICTGPPSDLEPVKPPVVLEPCGYLYIGQEIACVGFPKIDLNEGPNPVVSYGRVSTRKIGKGKYNVMLSAAISGGYSGGPCIDILSGDYIGIIKASTTFERGTNMAVIVYGMSASAWADSFIDEILTG